MRGFAPGFHSGLHPGVKQGVHPAIFPSPVSPFHRRSCCGGGGRKEGRKYPSQPRITLRTRKWHIVPMYISLVIYLVIHLLIIFTPFIHSSQSSQSSHSIQSFIHPSRPCIPCYFLVILYKYMFPYTCIYGRNPVKLPIYMTTLEYVTDYPYPSPLTRSLSYS